jgi:hypothetical protein
MLDLSIRRNGTSPSGVKAECPNLAKTYLRVAEGLPCIQTIDGAKFAAWLHPRIDDSPVFVPQWTEYLSNPIHLLGCQTILGSRHSAMQYFRPEVARIWMLNDAVFHPIDGVALP